MEIITEREYVNNVTAIVLCILDKICPGVVFLLSRFSYSLTEGTKMTFSHV